MLRASSGISACRVWRMDQPTTLRVCMSRMRQGRANLRRSECRSDRRARSGWAPQLGNREPSGWAQSDILDGCRSFWRDAARRPGRADRRGASGDPRGNARSGDRDGAVWRARGASRNTRCFRHGLAGCPQSARGWRRTSGSRGDPARLNIRWLKAPALRTSFELTRHGDAHRRTRTLSGGRSEDERGIF